MSRDRCSHMLPLPSTTITNATTAVAHAVHSHPSQFICIDGRKICIGDCALFKPPRDSPPFIGIIRKLTLTFNKDESPSLQVNWLYRRADLKLAKGILLEAAPNEVFYSFHEDETPAASLLHPCKVAFLHKGVELPSGTSAFVCRRVYDIHHKCLRWLTDKDYLNERQEEVEQLLDKTKLEMHGAVQSGGRSPKHGPTSTPSLKSGSDSIQNSCSFSSQGKGKKRDRGDQGSDSFKRERLTKTEDGDSGQIRPESMLKSEIAQITDKGGFVDFEGVERLIQLMQPDSADKKIDLAGRIMLVDVIALTDQYDCLDWFVQLKGLPILDEWLQEVHKGKIGDGNMPKESDKSVDDFLLALLRALDKLPVNLHALQTCNVGKSVNHLRSHKNSEIQKKARSLVDTWKKRVEVEMNMNDGKSGSTRAVWQAKPAPSYVSQVGNRKTGGSSEVAAKSSGMQPSISKNSQAKLNSGEASPKYSPSPGSTKSMTTSLVSNSRDQNVKMLVGSGTLDLPLSSLKEERSSSSSQSQNNSLSCSSEHPKTTSSCMEDAKSSTAVSMSVNKILGGSSRTLQSSNGLHGAGVTVAQKEPGSRKNSSRNSPSEKVSPTHVSHEKIPDLPLADQGNNQRLILRLPNTGRSPVRGVSGATFEEPAVPCGKASPPADKNENQDRRVKAKTDGMQSNIVSNLTTDGCDANEAYTGYEEDNGSPTCDEQCRVSEDGDKVAESSKPTSSLLGFVSRSGQTYASLSPMNALVESCVKFSEASASVFPGDDGMNLLATVAAGEISRSENVSPLASPQRKSPVADESSSGNDGKSKHSSEAVTCTPGQFDDTRHPVAKMSCDLSGDGEAGSSSYIAKMDYRRTQMNSSSSDLLQNAEVPCLCPESKEGASEIILPGDKETHLEPGGENLSHEQRESAKSSNNSESKLKSSSSSFDKEQKVDHQDEGTMENGKVSVSKGAGESVKIEKEVSEKPPGFSSDLGNENQIITERVLDMGISVKMPSPVAEKNCVPEETKKEPRAENVDDIEPGEIEPDEKQVDLDSSVSAGTDECAEENLGRKEVIGHCFNSAGPPESPSIPVQENELLKTSECNLDAIESDGAGVNVSLAALGSDAAVKLNFDLNEGFPVDDVSHGDIVRQEEPITSSAVHVPTPLTLPISSMSGGFHASVTVASAAKGPVIPPKNPLRSKGELGWKGSAATSAFRPAEPRKNAEPSSNTSDIPSADAAALKRGRPPLDFDLNVPDQRSFEDVASLGSPGQTHLDSGAHDRSTVGIDLDLNRVDETPEIGSFSMSKLDITSLPNKSSSSGGLSNGGSSSRDFDLNNGPGLDEVGIEAPTHNLQMKGAVPFPSTVYGVRRNNTEFGNYSSWFPSGNSYSAITVPPLLPGRGEQSYVAGAGAQRILGPPASTSFGPEIYRGPVLSSSPAVAYPPFPYPGFPFETNFPLSSNSFSGSTTFMDSSAVGGVCFPNMATQPVGHGGVISSTFPRPYVMSLPGGTSNVISESRKWGSHSLDLNSGPGGMDTERRDDRLPSGFRQLSVPNSQALTEEQMKMLQVAGSVLKRKEPDSGWDGADRFSYKQPSWQ